MAGLRGSAGPPRPGCERVRLHGGSSATVLARIARRYRGGMLTAGRVLAEVAGLDPDPVADPELTRLARVELGRSAIRALALVCPEPNARVALRLQLYLAMDQHGPQIAVFAALPPARAWLAGPANGFTPA